MRELADGVFQLGGGFPPNSINVYLLGDVLVDAGSRHAARRILRQVRGRSLSGLALTHAHPDHQGAAAAVCDRLEIPLWCGEGDVWAMETPGGVRKSQPSHWLNTTMDRLMSGPARRVDRALREGDHVAGFEVLEVPGHSAGHVAYWRASDGVLVLGDVLNNMNLLTGIPGLHLPPTVFTPDPARNLESARRLAALEPRLVLFGHGPPLRDAGKLARFVEARAAP